jgi:hypothetical protein
MVYARPRGSLLSEDTPLCRAGRQDSGIEDLYIIRSIYPTRSIMAERSLGYTCPKAGWVYLSHGMVCDFGHSHVLLLSKGRYIYMSESLSEGPLGGPERKDERIRNRPRLNSEALYIGTSYIGLTMKYSYA